MAHGAGRAAGGRVKRMVIVLVGILLTSTACADPVEDTGEKVTQEYGNESGDLFEQRMLLDDGRKVTCIVFAVMSAGGVSCDWEHAGEPLLPEVR